MSLTICSINSGSNGNCYYVGNEDEAVLVDAGISCRETAKRMLRAGLRMERVKAIFISHEHGDHIRGLEGISRKFNLPVYITEATHRCSRVPLGPGLIRRFADGETIQIGSLSVKAFSKLHDASDPHSFVISTGDIRVGVFTDLGAVCEKLAHHFRLCHAAFLEANYDEAMLEQGRYPWHLKNRIRGGYGHLSNRQALELFMSHRPAFMSHLLLSHLSRDNNRPELALAMFGPHAGKTQVSVASRYEVSPVFHIHGKPSSAYVPVREPSYAVQASLF